MSFLDKAREKATKLASTAKDKVDDFKDQRKADDLLADLGRLTYRQHTAQTEPGDAAQIAKLVADLQDLEAQGAMIVPTADADAEPITTDPLPPPPPPAPAT